MASSLEQLKAHTVVVADTGDFEQIAKYTPQDATTNPSLLFAASQLPQYRALVDDAVAFGVQNGTTETEQVERALDKLAVNFGIEILKLIPGRVSTEIDARLSFDAEKTVERGRGIIQLYRDAGIDSDRILLKIASTWEGLQAARVLENEGLHVNMTLMFSHVQAMAAGEAGVTLISPFAGRITDWFKVKEKVDGFPAADDPGVKSVKFIYNYLKKHGYKTVVMGASFRNKEQVMELCGCDLLTVSPKLLGELQECTDAVPRRLSAEEAECDLPKTVLDEPTFRRLLNDDEMAHFKLAEGIRKFTVDLEKLEKQVLTMIRER